MSQTKIIKKEVAMAELARRHHIDFMKFMWQRSDKFTVGIHTEAVCEVIDEAIEKLKNGVSSYLAIKLHVRSGKSDILSRYLPANFIGKFPDDEVIVSGYAYSLVRTFSKFARNLLKDPKYQLVYPKVKLAKKSQSLDNWGIEDHLGETHWVGLGGGITGKSGKCILLDDFCKGRLEAESPVYRDRVWDAFTNDIITRRAPVSIVVVLATPWNVDDIFGRIDKKRKEDPFFPEFTEISFPAFSDKYPTGVLFPERYSLEWYTSMRAMLGPYASAGLLDCNPVARGGNIFQVDKIQYYDTPPEGIQWCRGWDTASTEKQRVSEDPDYTVGAKVGIRWIAISSNMMVPQIYVDDIVSGRWAAPKRNDVIRDTVISDGLGVQVAIEGYGSNKDAYEEIKHALKGVKEIKKSAMPGDKVVKASPLESPMAIGNFFIRRASWNEDFIKEFREFPGASHDDIVDAVAVGFDAHDPYEKRVWPQIQNKHVLKLDIRWSKAGVRDANTLHYVSLYQKEDLTLWAVCALWDALKGYLFIYDSFMVDDPIPSNIARKIVYRAKIQEYKIDGIVCNDTIWETEVYSKNIATQYRTEIRNVYNVDVKFIRPTGYDVFGSIVEVGHLFDKNLAFIDLSNKEFVIQVTGWTTVKTGGATGYRPDTDNDGYCRALCLLVSELRKRDRWKKIIKPIMHDYRKTEEVQGAYNDAQKIFGVDAEQTRLQL